MIILASFSFLISFFFCDASDLTDLLLGCWLAFLLVLSSPLCDIDYLPYSFGGYPEAVAWNFTEINLKYPESRLILNSILCQ